MANDLETARRPVFPGADSIVASHSQAWQDIFVLCMLGGKRDGSYLEIGAQVPIQNNNTYLLEKQFGWSGVSVEIDPAHLPAWRAQRPGATFVVADALRIDYATAMPLWFGDRRRIDYLQLDIDPSIQTLLALERLPLDVYRFSTITFEHDAYAGDLRAREESRAILTQHGYRLVAPDVQVIPSPAFSEPVAFEDWWVDPQALCAADA